MQMLLHCSVPSGGAGRPRTHGYDGRNKQCKPSGLHGRGVNRISAEGKHRRSREQHGMPRVSREFSDSRIRRAEQAVQAVRLAWPRREPYFRRSRISQKPETARPASQGRDGCPVCTGGKCYGFATNRFTFPGRMGEGCRQNGRRTESAIIPRGKVLWFRGKSIHFPRKNGRGMQAEWP